MRAQDPWRSSMKYRSLVALSALSLGLCLGSNAQAFVACGVTVPIQAIPPVLASSPGAQMHGDWAPTTFSSGRCVHVVVMVGPTIQVQYTLGISPTDPANTTLQPAQFDPAWNGITFKSPSGSTVILTTNGGGGINIKSQPPGGGARQPFLASTTRGATAFTGR